MCCGAFALEVQRVYPDIPRGRRRLAQALKMAETPQQSQAHAKLEERWSKLGFEALSHPEQEAIALFWLEGEVMNGGLHQFFANSCGDLSSLVLSGLARLGAKQTLAQFESAISKLGAGLYLHDRQVRLAHLERLPPDAFDAETVALQAYPEPSFRLALADLAIYYSASHD
ncbi:DUF4375 domain-containing protein [Rudaea sp. 3F27F6]|uniref:DMP19 family protein n=2 Tax=unclassified Rudaea TaxID=2627037 RepID=UPI002015F6FC|nr:DUF4375 domain-containing protein [Rudaea sp. 3F27F6]